MTTIGLFDSGFGGLTVAREVRRQMPCANIEYYGDNGRAPYGSRTRDEIVRMTRQCVDFLASKDLDLLIIACNTATVAAFDQLTGKYPFPVIGVIEAGVNAAIATTKNNKVGVIATQFTIQSEAHKKAIQEANPEIDVIGKACPSFCPLIEAGVADSPEMDRDAREYLSVYKDSGIDTLVLACTHYPLIADTIRRHIPDGVAVVDPAVETVKQAIGVLKERGVVVQTCEPAAPGRETSSRREELERESERRDGSCECAPTYHFYTSGDPVHFEKLGSRFFGAPTGKVQQVKFE